jgi:hypothetical protein
MGTVAKILPALLQLLEMAPQLGAAGLRILAAVQDIWMTVTSETPATVDENEKFQAAFQATHDAFQASATRVDPDDPDV